MTGILQSVCRATISRTSAALANVSWQQGCCTGTGRSRPGYRTGAFVKPGFLEAVVDICCDDEIVFSGDQAQKHLIERFGGVLVAVDENIPAPMGPIGFRRGKGVKSLRSSCRRGWRTP